MLDEATNQALSGPSKARRLSSLNHLKTEPLLSDVAEILLSIENVPSTIVDYRNRELHLETLLKMARDKKKSEVIQATITHSLLGSLYVNFERFWGPTIRAITELIIQSEFKPQLIQIILNNLKHTNNFIYDAYHYPSEDLSVDRPDYIKHRNFVFQLLERFSCQVESDHLIFIEEFFRFVQKEMLVSPFIEKFTRISLTTSENNPDSSTSPKEPLSHEDKKSTARNSYRKGGRKVRRGPLPEAILEKRKSRETFLTAIKIVQSFGNIQEVYRNNEIRLLLLDLLCCRDSSVQKASFNCLMIFDKYKHLESYSERILKIICDKTAKTELTMFSIDSEETEQVQIEDREHLLPIVLRILFGKMLGKIGNKSSGKDKADHRKGVIMRFISGCTEDEIIHFFSLIFEPIMKYVDVPYRDLEQVLDKDYDPSNYIPINRLHAMLNSLLAYMNSVAHLKETILPQVLKLINLITYYVVTPLENKCDKLDDKIISSLKSLKRICLNTISQFFKSFQYYSFSQDEIEFVFKYLIWTSTQGFVDRNYAYPTPLFKFVASLAEIKVYHPLLVMRNDSNRSEYLLRLVVDCYADTKTKREVLQSIASIFANIIQPDRDLLEDPDLDPAEVALHANLPMLNITNALVPTFDRSLYKINSDLSFSEEILISFIPTIFKRLRDSCQEIIDKKETNYRMNDDELFVLSTLCGYLKDPQQSLVAARLLLMTLGNLKKTDSIVVTLKTVQSLLAQVENNRDAIIISLIASHLGYQRNVEQRRELCAIIDILSKSDTRLDLPSKSIQLMNATSNEVVDAPDLVKWNQGFHLAIDYVESLDETTLNQTDNIEDSFILMIHQIGFVIDNLDRHEFSIRESCMVFYEKLAQKLNLIDIRQHSNFIDKLVNQTLLDGFIKRGLRDTNELVKHSYIGILRSLALYCNQKSKILAEFHKFCNENQDLDFWLNIKHIQIHNRSKALAKLSANEEFDSISAKTLSSYFMPIAAGFLFSKAYKSVANIAENAIKVIGMICKRLNWVTYESTLSYYLDLLTKANFTYQRTNIKLVTEIIRNFNFDLTACKEATQHQEENAKLEKRMKKRIKIDSDDISLDAPSGKRLNPSTAKMVYHAVIKRLVPRLNSNLHEMTRVEFEHDKNMSGYLPEKDEIKRIPLAYAIIQLLNLLPSRYILFRDHLPGLFLKLCSFLKSKNEQIRKVARATIVKVMNFLGPAYMPDLLRVLKQNLDKGFHIHVLNYTIHSVLEKLPLQYGTLDTSAIELIDSCFKEIFGRLSEDKEVAAILAKTMEAKKTKSYETLLILSSHISSEKLPYLINSIKETAKTANEPKTVNKLATCIQRIFTGLSKNSQFPLDKLLEFIRLSIEESIPSLKLRQKFEQAESLYIERAQTNSSKPVREDRYLITKDAPRDRIKSKINEKGNLHIVVDNSLRLLLHTFEVNKTTIKKRGLLKRRLDGFIGLLSTCLKSSSPRCVMRSLKCLYFIARAKIDLPTFQTKSNSIVKKIFILLSLYNGVGMAQGDNLEMIAMCFKTLTLLLLKCEHVRLSETQVRALITYIEQDLNDVSRQATAFGALHSLVLKKYEPPELPDIMVKVAHLLVTSEDDNVRSLSVKIWQVYFLEYKHEKNMLQIHLTKFLRQLEYEFIDGRRSVLTVVNAVITKFPIGLLNDYFELIFYLLSVRTVNEDSEELRSIIGRLIGLLLQRLPAEQSRTFNKFIIPWASERTPEMKVLGIKLISIFHESCQDVVAKDRGKIRQILEILSDALEIIPEAKATNGKKDIECSSEEILQNCHDHNSTNVVDTQQKLVYHALRLFQRLLNKNLISCTEDRYIELLKKIWTSISSKHLINKFTPIVLTSCELYMTFIGETNLVEALKVENPTSDRYVEWNASRIVRTLFDKCIDLLDRVDESDQLLDYLTGILVSLGRMVAESHSTIKFEEDYLDSFDNQDIIDYMLNLNDLPDDGFVQNHLPCDRLEAKKKVNLMWVSIKIVMQARKEVHLYGSAKSFRRDLVLKWTAAISQILGPKRLAPYIFLFLMTPVRELTDKGKSKTIERSMQHNTILLAEDLLKFIKNLIGLDRFGKIYSRVQLFYTRKRVERKKSEAILKIKNPQRGVKRKMKQSKNKDVKRRKSKMMSRNGGPRRTHKR